MNILQTADFPGQPVVFNNKKLQLPPRQEFAVREKINKDIYLADGTILFDVAFYGESVILPAHPST